MSGGRHGGLKALPLQCQSFARDFPQQRTANEQLRATRLENPHIEGGGWLCAILKTHEVVVAGHINQSEGGARPQHIARRHNDFKIDDTTASKIDIPRNLQGIKGAVQIHPQGRTGIDGEVIQPVQEITARCTGGGASQMQDSAVIEGDGVRATAKAGCTIHDESRTVIDIHRVIATA